MMHDSGFNANDGFQDDALSFQEKPNKKMKNMEGMVAGYSSNNNGYISNNNNNKGTIGFTGAFGPRYNTRRSTRSNKGMSQGDVATKKWKENGQFVLEKLEHNNLKCKVPILPPERIQNKQDKHGALKLAERNIRKANATWTDKSDAIEQLFATITPSAGSVADMAIQELDSIHRSDAFVFERVAIIDRTGNDLPIEGVGIPAATRQNAYMFKILLKMLPTRITPIIDLDVDPTKLGGEAQAFVYLMAPLTATNQLDAAIIRDHITDLHRRKEIVEVLENLQGQAPTFLMSRGPRDLPSQEIFESFWRKAKNHVRFDALCQAIQSLYVGTLDGLMSVNMQLQQLSYRVWNPTTKTNEWLRVQDLYDKINLILSVVDHANPPPDIPDLANCMLQALDPNLKENCIAILPTLTPQNPPFTLPQNISRLAQFLKKAKKEEAIITKEIILVDSRIRANSQRGRGVPPPRQLTQGNTFAAMPATTNQWNTGGFGHQGTFGFGDAIPTNWTGTWDLQGDNSNKNKDTQSPYTGSPSLVLPTIVSQTANKGNAVGNIASIGITCMAALEESCELLTMLSAAEVAMQKASGIQRPRECWGCNATDHMFSACPHKNDPKVYKRFMERLQGERQKGRFKRSNYGPQRESTPMTEADAQSKGYINTKIAKLLQEASDYKTPARERVKALAELKQAIGQSQEQQGNPRTALGTMNPLAFFGMPTDVTKVQQLTKNVGSIFLSGPSTTGPLQFAVNTLSLFMAFPIGKNYTGTTLKGLFDTGGCCNMGDRTYHEAIAAKHPQLVKELVELKEHQYEPIPIGGLEQQTSVEITHLITYHIPYLATGGANHSITIGLTDTIPVNTLYGLPFIIKADMRPVMKDMVVRSEVFDDEFPLTLEMPTKAPAEDLDYNTGMQKSLIAMPTSEGSILDLLY